MTSFKSQDGTIVYNVPDDTSIVYVTVGDDIAMLKKRIEALEKKVKLRRVNNMKTKELYELKNQLMKYQCEESIENCGPIIKEIREKIRNKLIDEIAEEKFGK